MCWTVRFFQTLLVLLSPRSSAMDRSSILGGSCAAGATKAHLACLRSERFYDGGGWLWGCPSTCGSAHTLPLLLLNPRFSSPCPPPRPPNPPQTPLLYILNPPLAVSSQAPLANNSVCILNCLPAWHQNCDMPKAHKPAARQGCLSVGPLPSAGGQLAGPLLRRDSAACVACQPRALPPPPPPAQNPLSRWIQLPSWGRPCSLPSSTLPTAAG